MPSYTFKCEDEHITELWCILSEKPETLACDECGKDATQIIKFPSLAHTRGCSEGSTKV